MINQKLFNQNKEYLDFYTSVISFCVTNHSFLVKLKFQGVPIEYYSLNINEIKKVFYISKDKFNNNFSDIIICFDQNNYKVSQINEKLTIAKIKKKKLTTENRIQFF